MLTNGIGSNSLHTSLLRADSAASKSIQRISSGKKITQASDNAAGSEMLSAFDAQARAMTQLMANQQSQASVLQTASSSLTTSTNILQSLSSLTAQAANGTLTDQDRAQIQQQINQLSSQIDMSANQSQFNGQNLLDGTFSTQLQNGQKFAIDAMTANALGLNGLSVATQGDATSAMGTVQNALNKVLSTQSGIGSVLNGISSSIANLQNQQMNALSAQSQIGDVDVASEVMKLTMSQMNAQESFRVFNMNESTRSNIMNLLSDN